MKSNNLYIMPTFVRTVLTLLGISMCVQGMPLHVVQRDDSLPNDLTTKYEQLQGTVQLTDFTSGLYKSARNRTDGSAQVCYVLVPNMDCLSSTESRTLVLIYVLFTPLTDLHS